ncbi:2-oxo acid dehydrogenase subunit E2 [Shinella sp. CPCC 100929]|uniref:Dihydrolipoamide acetyltransferase component of pyruvate dehydrogenase complex n=1 Tax=Shinella lacus TaxID=2654216 RepID=A0ABT1R1I6_9HYPH|nr:dihydrolipoamide acetyltransferase family protein [Shinella lacus]MCQ4628991.1 2-oxo acid dehydrogenase subunit E2 [Shinella lacus]
MAEFLVLPSVVANARDGTIARWLKAEGDMVASGEAFAEIETDKAVIEIPSPKAGRIARILHGDGATVPVETHIGVLAEASEDDATVTAFLSGAAPVEEAPPAVSAPAATVSAPAISDRIFASPHARRLARESGISLADLSGTGPRGRIMREDVEAFVAASLVKPAAVPAAKVVVAEEPAPVVAVDTPHVATPHSPMRRTIALRLTEAKRTIPHFYLNADIAMDALIALRAQINAERPDGGRLSVTDFLVKAAAVAFGLVPACNVIWTEPALLQLQRTDICVAVSTEGGLITPVVKDVGNKSLSVVSREIAELALRARNSTLRPDEYRGGSFTISNLGMHGVSDFTAIINPPQAAILAVGAIEERIVSRNSTAVSARMMRVTLSLDHRAIDGAVGAQWLASFKELVQNPMQILV